MCPTAKRYKSVLVLAPGLAQGISFSTLSHIIITSGIIQKLRKKCFMAQIKDIYVSIFPANWDNLGPRCGPLNLFSKCGIEQVLSNTYYTFHL